MHPRIRSSVPSPSLTVARYQPRGGGVGEAPPQNAAAHLSPRSGGSARLERSARAQPTAADDV